MRELGADLNIALLNIMKPLDEKTGEVSRSYSFYSPHRCGELIRLRLGTSLEVHVKRMLHHWHLTELFP